MSGSLKNDLLWNDLYRSIKNQLYLISLSIWIISYVLNNTLWSIWLLNATSLNYIRAFCVFLILIKELIDFQVDFAPVSSAIFLIVSGIITYQTSDIQIVLTAIFVFSARNVPLNSILRVSFWIITGTIIVTVFASLQGIIENRVFLKNDGTPRNGLGFLYTTYPAQWGFFASAMWITIRNSKIHYYELFMMFIVAIILYEQTHTANALICSCILILSVLCIKHAHRLFYKKKIRWIVGNVFVICAVLIIGLSVFFQKNPLFFELDRIFSNRLRLGNAAINKYGFSWFGQSIVMTGTTYGVSQKLQPNYTYIDSSYVQMIVKFGVVMLSFICFGFKRIILNAMASKKFYLCVSLFTIAIQGLLDPQLFFLGYDPFLLALGAIFLNKGGKER